MCLCLPLQYCPLSHHNTHHTTGRPRRRPQRLDPLHHRQQGVRVWHEVRHGRKRYACCTTPSVATLGYVLLRELPTAAFSRRNSPRTIPPPTPILIVIKVPKQGFTPISHLTPHRLHQGRGQRGCAGRRNGEHVAHPVPAPRRSLWTPHG